MRFTVSLLSPKRTHRLAEKYDVLIGLHTDHCQPKKVDSFLKPLIEATAARRAAGQGNLFQSHMYDGSELPLDQNIAQSQELLKLCAENEIILEVEAGVVVAKKMASITRTCQRTSFTQLPKTWSKFMKL